MEPTYSHMQIVLLDKHSDHYVSGDVIAFYCETLECVLVKRIVAGPEDTAQIVGGTLMVNNQISKVFPCVGTIFDPGILAEPIRLGKEQYLVLGDNLHESKDSRDPDIGVVALDKIHGKVCMGNDV